MNHNFMIPFSHHLGCNKETEKSNLLSGTLYIYNYLLTVKHLSVSLQ